MTTPAPRPATRPSWSTLTHVLYGGEAAEEADERHVRRLVDLLLRTG